jgi:hypothetical protein
MTPHRPNDDSKVVGPATPWQGEAPSESPETAATARDDDRPPNPAGTLRSGQSDVRCKTRSHVILSASEGSPAGW